MAEGKYITDFRLISDEDLANDTNLWIVGDEQGILYKPTMAQMKGLITSMIPPSSGGGGGGSATASNGLSIDGGSGDVVLGGSSLVNDVSIDGNHAISLGTWTTPIGSFGVDTKTSGTVYGNMHIGPNSFDYAVASNANYLNYNWADGLVQADIGNRASGKFSDFFWTEEGVAYTESQSPSLSMQSTILQLNSTTKGFLPPRMTKVQRNTISSPVTGLMVYQIDNIPGLRVFNGTNWVRYTETVD